MVNELAGLAGHVENVCGAWPEPIGKWADILNTALTLHKADWDLMPPRRKALKPDQIRELARIETITGQ